MRKISQSFLKKIRKKAIRKRIWYKAIDSIDRGIVNLTINLVENIKSLTLLKVLKSILKKIKESHKSDFIKHCETYGLIKAEKIVKQAIDFGYEYATTWLSYRSFSQLLALNGMNDPHGWR